MVSILCPFCDREIELDKDLSGEYLCPMCEETVLYENKDLLEKPIVFGKYSNFFTLENILSGLFLILFSIATFGIVAIIVLLAFVVKEVSEKREINRRMIAGDPYPEKISAYGIRIDVNKKMKLLHWKEKKQLEFYPNELTSIEHTQKYYKGRFKLFSSIFKRSLEFTQEKESKGYIKIFLNDSYACSILDLTTKQGVEICSVLKKLYGVSHSVDRQAIEYEGGDGGSGGG